jgi:hypothetical protein
MRQEDVDTGCLFGNFLQFPAFRATPRPGNPSPFSAEFPWLERCECDNEAIQSGGFDAMTIKSIAIL